MNKKSIKASYLVGHGLLPLENGIIPPISAWFRLQYRVYDLNLDSMTFWLGILIMLITDVVAVLDLTAVLASYFGVPLQLKIPNSSVPMLKTF